MTDTREDRIRLRAYRIWQEKGRPHESADSERQDWLQAESEIEAEELAEAGQSGPQVDGPARQFPGSEL
ncbi:MAG: DUF2934 domain-containing protein [Pararhizobium sp.]